MNELKKLSEFQSILHDYHVSEHARTILSKTDLLLLAGVTSSGRNTIVNELLKTGDYHYIVSDTTRKPRLNHGQLEENGREYWFKTETEFLEGLQNGNYLEAAIIHGQQVSGISIQEIEQASKEGKIATTDIEMNGVSSIVAVKPDTISLFVMPPNFTEWMQRLNGRGTMPEDELRRRLKSAVNEINIALRDGHYTLIINGEFHETTKMIIEIDEKLPDQVKARKVARQLCEDTRKFLADSL